MGTAERIYSSMRALVRIVGLLLFCAALAEAQDPLRIETTTLPAPVVGAYYSVQLQASGGRAPLTWSVAEGALPPGIQLDHASGLLTGTPTKVGAFNFTVRVTDNSTPPQIDTQKFAPEVASAIVVRWIRPPRVENGGIFGSVEVTNNLPEQVDLTLIIVGVNEIGLSHVLGYQHPTLGPKKTTQAVPFGFTLPRGSYVVHVDAVAEHPRTEALFRARMQTPAALQVP